MTSDTALPTIVVLAHKRPESLVRLLRSLQAAKCSSGTRLLISIDYGGPPNVSDIARDFAWHAGPKIVHFAERNLGLVQHMLLTCDRAACHGPFVLLEDDLVVSPHFYDFATAALLRYRANPRLAGLSLYSHGFNETAHQSFLPIDDGTDVFFIQLMSWGHVWTADQWLEFRAWLEDDGGHSCNRQEMPVDVRSWPETSWKKHFIAYMVTKDLYSVQPRVSCATNFQDPGSHNNSGVNYLQVSLTGGQRQLSLPALSESRSVYDAWCEIVPDLLSDVLSPFVGDAEICVDLYGQKNPKVQSRPYMLTTQPCREATARFGLKMRPREANILYGIGGNDISLAPTDAVVARQFRRVMPYREYCYTYDHLRMRDLATIVVRKLVERFRNRIH